MDKLSVYLQYVQIRLMFSLLSHGESNLFLFVAPLSDNSLMACCLLWHLTFCVISTNKNASSGSYDQSQTMNLTYYRNYYSTRSLEIFWFSVSTKESFGDLKNGQSQPLVQLDRTQLGHMLRRVIENAN